MERLLIAWAVLSWPAALFIGACIRTGMNSPDPSPSQAARALGKLSDAEYKRRKAAKTAQLRAELGR